MRRDAELRDAPVLLLLLLDAEDVRTERPMEAGVRFLTGSEGAVKCTSEGGFWS